MNLNNLYRERLTKKVCAKLFLEKNSFEVESKFKDWLAGAGMAIISLFSGVGDASATAEDAHNYLKNLEVKIENIKKRRS